MLLSSRITGPVALGAIFDVENLFAAVVQIKHEVKEDMKAAHTTMEIPRNVICMSHFLWSSATSLIIENQSDRIG